MPFDGIETFETHPLMKLGAVERLLATEQQWCKGRLRDAHGRHCLVGAIEGLVGFLLIGWSTAVFVTDMNKLLRK